MSSAKYGKSTQYGQSPLRKIVSRPTLNLNNDPLGETHSLQRKAEACNIWLKCAIYCFQLFNSISELNLLNERLVGVSKVTENKIRLENWGLYKQRAHKFVFRKSILVMICILCRRVESGGIFSHIILQAKNVTLLIYSLSQL